MMLRLVLVFIFTLIVQLGLLPGLAPDISTPELFIPVIITLAILYSLVDTCVFAILAGLVLDLFFIKGFGIRTLLFFSMGFFVGKAREKFSSSSVFVVLTLTLLLGALYQFLYFLIINALGETVGFKAIIKAIFSLELPIMMIYSIIAFGILNRANRRR